MNDLKRFFCFSPFIKNFNIIANIFLTLVLTLTVFIDNKREYFKRYDL